MEIEVTDEHIEEVASAKNYSITDMKELKRYIAKKVVDEAREDGATHLCIFLENMIDLAYEDNTGVEI